MNYRDTEILKDKNLLTTQLSTRRRAWSRPLRLVAVVLLFPLAASFGNCRASGPVKKSPEERPPTDKDVTERRTVEPDKKNEPGEDKKNEPAEIKSDRPDTSGRPVKTFFSGGVLIREIVTVNGFPMRRITIAGGAVLRHNDVTIAAPRLVIDGGVHGRLVGGVTITDPKNGVRIKAERADYDRNLQTVVLTGSPFMTVQKNKNEKAVFVTAEKLIRDLAKSSTSLDKDVRVLHEVWTLIADRGTYHDEGDFLVLEDNPAIISPGRFFTGEKLFYRVKERKIELDNNAVFLSSGGESLNLGFKKESGGPVSLEEFARTGGKAAPVDSNSTKPDKERSISAISADKLEYLFPENAPPVTTLTGNIVFTQNEMTLKTPRMVTRGKDFNFILADQGVDLIERKQNVHVVAGIMTYDRTQELIRLEKSPRMEFLQKDSDTVSATLSGRVIERQIKHNKIVARGDVKIARENYLFTGELATYDESAGVIVLEGEPTMREEGGGLIQCEQVLMFPETNRILLMNRITGYIMKE